VADHPLIREPSYHALNRRDAGWWADLGTYRALIKHSEPLTGLKLADVMIICFGLET
jgi:hypothetical protein